MDPIGLAGGIDLYQYAPNSLTWIDPLGWENSWICVNPNDLNCSQAYILENNYAELMDSEKWIWDKPLNVMEVNGQLVSLDN